MTLQAAGTPPTLEEQCSHLQTRLAELERTVSTIPSHFPEGSADGAIARYFSDYEVDEDEGPYFTVNRAWDRTFQVSEEDKIRLVTRGEWGMKLVHSFAVYFARVPGIEANNGLLLLAQRVQSIIDLIGKVVPGQSSGAVNNAPIVSEQSKKPEGLKSKIKEASIRGKKRAADPKEKGRKQKDLPAKKRKLARNGKATAKPPDSGSSGSSAESDGAASDVDNIELRGGRAATKAKWAFSQYEKPTPATCKGKRVWMWKCRWCPAYRSSSRTKGCTNYEDETESAPRSSNFISHLEKYCTGIPESQTWSAWISGDVVEEEPGEARAAPGALGAQCAIMREFTARGLENPQKKVTKHGFRELFVKGIIEDDLPFSFGEKKGMKKCFLYALPADYKVPGHQMVSRDLQILYEALRKELDDRIKRNNSRIAISNDLWSSKNAQYAFAGTTGFWISAEWKLEEWVLEFLPLDGDHSGKVSGKLVFKALRKRGVTEKLITNTADNTASNNLMNCALAKRIVKSHSIQADPVQIQIGCSAHVLNLVVQALLHKIGAAPDPDKEDLYPITREFPLVYDAEKDPKVVEESMRMAAEASGGEAESVAVAGNESDGYSSSDDDDNDNEIGEAVGGMSRLQGKPAKDRKELNPVEKLHAIVVDILRSEPRRRRMRQYIRQLCHKDYKHLVPVKSMPVRWNTTYAEIDRTIKLRPAINQWVEQLDAGTTGKAKQAAQRKQKQLHLELRDWQMLESLRDTLEIFHEATLDLSKANEPTICKTLPLYKLIEHRLEDERTKIYGRADPYSIEDAMNAALKKLSLYIQKAFISDYPLLGAVLHPSIRLCYFENSSNWDAHIPQRARQLLQKLYDEYSAAAQPRPDPANARKDKTANSSSIFSQAIYTDDATADDANVDELDAYFRGSYACREHDKALEWWKDHSDQFPVLSRIARDVLAIPGVSVSVERLFSSSKHTLSDACSSLLAETASIAVVSKELLKKGLGKNLQYLDGISIHE